MEKYYQVYFDLLKNVFWQMETILNEISQEALDWDPGIEMNSIAVLTAHTAGATRFLIGDMVGGENSNRNRTAEFETSDLTAEVLRARLEETQVHSRTVLEGLKLEDLHAVRIHPRDGQEYTVTWCLGHALEHAAQHLGHMEVTRQMWEMQNI
jgi:uncharacterized damage-inducible protein DinB